MQYCSSISILKSLGNSASASPSDLNGLIKDLSASSRSFDSFLQDNLYSVNSNENQIINHEKNDISNIDKNNSENPSFERLDTSIKGGNRQIADDDKTIRGNNSFHSSGQEDIHKTDNAEPGVKSKNKSEDKLEQKERIQKNAQENTIKNQNEDIRDDIPVLLKEINFLLNLIKGLHFDKKQIQDIRTTLSELKDFLEQKNNKNIVTDKNPHIALNGHELKKMLERLRNLLETAHARIGHKNFRSNDARNIKDPENIIESSDIGILKKQISRLVNEIRQHLNNQKLENVISKNFESLNENKDINNQKLFSEISAGDKNEGSQARDNTSSFSFSFLKKDIEGAGVLQKSGNPGAEKRNSFGNELNTILLNAKIVVRDSGNGSFSIRLHPESLGRVNVNLNLEHGVVMGRFLVDSIEAKEALLENIQTIIDRLQEDGISVGNFNVNVRDEKKSLFDFNKEAALHSAGRRQTVAAGAEYESNSLYVHNGEIDLII
ncbi:MAG: flagellar hook-length control protein FliK [Spirochaetes bacterium]|nr:flagellar hook-length control protein FliK [Spirochaetota bacterium]